MVKRGEIEAGRGKSQLRRREERQIARSKTLSQPLIFSLLALPPSRSSRGFVASPSITGSCSRSTVTQKINKRLLATQYFLDVFQFGFMFRIIKFLFTEMKRMTLYTVVGDLESKSFKHADLYNSPLPSPPPPPPPPPQKKLNVKWFAPQRTICGLRRTLLVLNQSYYWMLLIDSPAM